MDDFLMTLPERVGSEHTAIVVSDMQNDFCAKDGYLDSHSGVDEGANKALAGRIMDLVEAGRRAGTEIVWVQAIYDPKYMPPPFLVRRRERGIDAVCCAEGTWGAEFYEMSAKDDEIFIENTATARFAALGSIISCACAASKPSWSPASPPASASNRRSATATIWAIRHAARLRFGWDKRPARGHHQERRDLLRRCAPGR